MRKLSDSQCDFIRLLLRSPDIGRGWRTVGKMVAPATEKMFAEHPELYEIDRSDGVKIRLSERGLVIADYV